MAEMATLWIVRHGESTANVAASAAEAAGSELIDLSHRDADVPLSDTGREQAQATARWLAGLPEDRRPDVAVVSPYLRAVQTADLALDGTGIPVSRDERLRDRELGILDGLTAHGVRRRYPDEAARRDRLGKFYYRPPGGEAWTDVALRLRALLGDLRRDHEGRRVLLFGHDALVFLTRYLVEGLTEEELMALTRRYVIANCSVTGWSADADGRLRPDVFNDVGHLHAQGARPTREDEVHAEPV
ncbi:histidine phosphatase family protein [Micromonospora endolithica]|uniref:phosphoglycerate mutase (2,3-diphosphoglycerate-dependent) n=1 Tax=Micromonospora endolithica TaxID=230091 RepID=A0A3A9YY76_9ACTN|nr:histidine phosphatase family protein [Micromonospora endolithica]RKN40624.1 histidine phosphatase family protein [Micromonospora endolithica]TWJ21708.1 broad specificity phosphatase PhoE [Micromonospora endolithica]